MKSRSSHRGIGKGSMLATLRLLAAFCISTLLAPLTFAGSKSSADFLKIPIGAQGAAMGQAYTALAEGVDSLNWNPAGIALAPSYTNNPSLGMSVSRQEQAFGTGLDQLGVVLPSSLNRHTALGINLVRMTYGAQEERSADRQKTGSFESYDLSLGLSAARNFNGVFAGAQVKVIREQLASYTADGYAIDMGLQGAGPINRMYYGVAVKNLGPKMKFINDSFQLPLTLSLGTAYRITGPLALTVDVHHRPYQSQTTVAMGAQFAASRSVALRAGYMAKLSDAVTSTQRNTGAKQGSSFGNLNGVGAGLGFRFSRFTMDYALTPFGELGNTQTVTISSWFGGRSAKRDLDIQLETEKKAPAQRIPLANVETQTAPVTLTPAAAPAQADQRQMLDVPLQHEDWWNNMR